MVVVCGKGSFHGKGRAEHPRIRPRSTAQSGRAARSHGRSSSLLWLVSSVLARSGPRRCLCSVWCGIVCRGDVMLLPWCLLRLTSSGTLYLMVQSDTNQTASALERLMRVLFQA